MKTKAKKQDAKHTPGPWNVGKDAAYFVYPTNPDGTADMLIAHVEHRANARLIAAAPELLEAVREAEARLWSEGTGNGECVYCGTQDNDEHDPGCVVVVLRAAIAKAEGRNG